MSNTDLNRKERKSGHKKLYLNLPIPPSVNSLYTMQRKLTAKARKYIANSQPIILDAINDQNWHMPEKNEWLYLDMVFYMPDKRIRDSHNALKLLLDVLQDLVYVNDYTVMPRIQSVEYDKDNPRVEVLVTHQTVNQRDKGLSMFS